MPQLDDRARDLAHDQRLDPLAHRLDAVAAAIPPAVRPTLEGAWLGHAVHPFLTDIPIGCWTSANVLDLVGGRSSRRAARLLMGAGLLAALPTAAAGLAELGRVQDDPTRRVAATHAALNAGALVFYASSWLARRRGDHLRGVFHGLIGSAVATASGFLGGHLSFALGTGVGQRSGEEDANHRRIPDVDLTGGAPASEQGSQDGSHTHGNGVLPTSAGPASDAMESEQGDVIA